MRLANFPDIFGLTEMKKGYFPHLGIFSLASRENQGKIESGAIFDFRQEMEDVLVSDEN